MIKKELIIIGGGGFAKVLVEAIIRGQEYHIAGFCVDNIPVGYSILEKYEVISDPQLSSIDIVNNYFFIVALGDNKIRKEYYENALKKCKPAIIIHPSAVIESHVQIGDGSVIMANAVINPYSKVGENTIVNTGVIIDHDCKIGNHVHLSIGSIIGSHCSISDGTTISIGETVLSLTAK